MHKSVHDTISFHLTQESLDSSEIIFVTDDGENLNARPHQHGILKSKRFARHSIRAPQNGCAPRSSPTRKV